MNGAAIGGGQPLRQRVMEALWHFWCPLHVEEELRPYLEGTWGEPVAADALAGLLAAQRRALEQAGAAAVRICLGIFPDGHAAKDNVMALTELKPSPEYEKVVETCGGRGEKVEGPGDLVPALRRGLEAVHAGTPVTLNVQTQARR